MRLIHFPSTMMMVAAAAAVIIACSGDDPKQDYNPLIDDPKEDTPAEQPAEQGGRDEQYRPQVHFTPAKNWINDPNGMVYLNGTYHLFYQYNPQGNDWGNMSWGHATSTDLMHWTELPVALTRDELGDVFSGSCVIDKDNTAGFGAGSMVAVYTSASGVQQQSIAYSTDEGKSFTRYTANPVVRNDDDNLRDPKVFWHAESRQWVMALAKGWKKGVEFYGSADLKSWRHLSTFFVELPGRPSLQWECPDLIQMGDRWVLLVSVNPGGPILGSGTMYFLGQFDGKEFKTDAEFDSRNGLPHWLDYGMDNYAGVTWSNTGDRKIMIGWMNNWSYSDSVPCSPWRSAMTLPRELKLIEYDGQPLLANTVVKEVESIAATWQPVTTQAMPVTAQKGAYQLRLTVSMDKNTTVTLGNAYGEHFSFDVNASTRTLTAHRTAATGKTSFNGTFSIPSIQAPLNTAGDRVTLDLFVDQSSVEIFTESGSMSMTNLVFPQAIYTMLTVTGADYEAKVRQLRSIW
ncbi:MAG: glycoside hydrolase family 32 protein [Prevotella sp.]|nr:glycoside hydrolase family 32 protein [Prevotella sp.]